MMAKITKGSQFAGAVKYILDPKKGAELIGADGVRLKDLESISRSFELQRETNSRVSKPVGHISLDFSAQDRDKLNNITMLTIALEYMKRMDIKNTQFIIGRHYDRGHPHIHILYNRVDNNGLTISDQHDRTRSTKICRDLTLKHNLYVSSGKENVNRHRLREPAKTKYEIYDALVKHVATSRSWAELQTKLRTEGIEVGFKTKGSTSQVEGVRFTMNNLSFNGSKVDRQFSYSKIDYQLRCNCREIENSINRNIDRSTDVNVDRSTNQQVFNSSELLGGSLGLFDIGTNNPAIDPEEEAFRRQMQRKKKKGIRR